MAKNSQKRKKAAGKVRLPIPTRPPGQRLTGDPLHDLNALYGGSALHDPSVRAKIRRDTKGQVEVKRIDGKWQAVPAGQPI